MRSGTFSIVGPLVTAVATASVLTSCEGSDTIESRRIRGYGETLEPRSLSSPERSSPRSASGWVKTAGPRSSPRIEGGGGPDETRETEAREARAADSRSIAAVKPATLKSREPVRPRQVAASPVGGTGLPPAEARDFRLVDVALVSTIRDRGDYDLLPRRSFSPGASILLYGEFAGFGKQLGASGESLRGFSGVLTLRDSAGSEVDSLVFLSPESGLEPADDREEIVNFWARYRIPDELSPGRYELHVSATDLVTQERSRVALSLRVESELIESDLPVVGSPTVEETLRELERDGGAVAE